MTPSPPLAGPAADPVPPVDAAFFAEVIVRARTSRKLSQDALAQLCGVPQPAVARWERGKGLIQCATIAKVASALQIPVGVLLYPLSAAAFTAHYGAQLKHRRPKKKPKGGLPRGKRSS